MQDVKIPKHVNRGTYPPVGVWIYIRVGDGYIKAHRPRWATSGEDFVDVVDETEQTHKIKLEKVRWFYS